MARKWESNEPQRERESEIHVVLPEMTPEYLAALPKHTSPLDVPAPVERLSPDELIYHQKIWARRLKADAAAALAAETMGSWWEHLMEKYGMAAGDLINQDGFITRVAAPEATGSHGDASVRGEETESE